MAGPRELNDLFGGVKPQDLFAEVDRDDDGVVGLREWIAFLRVYKAERQAEALKDFLCHCEDKLSKASGPVKPSNP